jgi:Protein of unknown function (DUF998)
MQLTMNTDASGISTIAAKVTIASGILSLLALALLHILSPEFDPSWRMASEYALGRHKWAISLFFVFWGIASIALGVMLWPLVTGKAAKIGVVLLFVSGVGSSSAALFDVQHSLHGLSGALGIPTVIIASLLIAYHLRRKSEWQPFAKPILMNAHATWISLLLMVATMMLMITGFQSAGIEFSEDSGPPTFVPENVIAVGGYANRILIFVYIYWLILVAKSYLKIQRR